MTNPRLSSHFFARPIRRMTSPGSLPSKSRSEKGVCLPPPHLGAIVTHLSAFLRDAGVAGRHPCAAFGNSELGLRQFTPAGLADFCHHIRLFKLLLIPVFVSAENFFRVHTGKQTPQKTYGIINYVGSMSNYGFHDEMFF